MQQPPRLPLELILQILEASFPHGGPHLIADVSTDDVQMLVKWAQVCRSTYEPATRFLRQHCVYLNSVDRVRKFSQCLTNSASNVASTLPPTIPLTSASFIYIGLDKESIQSPHTSSLIKDLFMALGSSVRRLVFDLPFRRLADSGFDMDGIDSLLSEGLAALTNMEEFVTTGGLPALDFWGYDSSLVRQWPKLRRLAGFQVNLAEGVWRNVARSRSVEEVVIARPFLLRIQKWNVKQAIAKHWKQEEGGDPSYARHLKVRLADHEFSPPLLETSMAELHDPLGLMDVSSFAVPMKRTRGLILRTDDGCRQWLMDAAKQDTLWMN
jgi:hypothetical protein